MNNKIQTTLGVLSALFLSSTVAFAFSGGDGTFERRDRLGSVDISEETQLLIDEHKAEQEEIRAERKAAAEAFLETNPEATREEIRAVIEQWNEDNADRLADQQELRDEIKEDIKEAVALPEELQADIDAHRAESARLKEGRRTAVSEFVEANPEATSEEIRAVITAYNETNAAEIVANLELGQTIRAALKELRPEANPIERLAARARLKEKRDAFKEKSDAYKEARQALRDLSPEERRAYLDENPEIRNAAREALKDLIRRERQNSDTDVRGAE
ncbi:MAG: hypothetical protein ACSHYA_00375 [Opitutaceae bacterium]